MASGGGTFARHLPDFQNDCQMQLLSALTVTHTHTHTDDKGDCSGWLTVTASSWPAYLLPLCPFCDWGNTCRLLLPPKLFRAELLLGSSANFYELKAKARTAYLRVCVCLCGTLCLSLRPTNQWKAAIASHFPMTSRQAACPSGLPLPAALSENLISLSMAASKSDKQSLRAVLAMQIKTRFRLNSPPASAPLCVLVRGRRFVPVPK